MTTFLFILLGIGLAVFIWDIAFGFEFRAARERREVMRHMEDNMFRVQYIIDTINNCETVEQLNGIKDWVDERSNNFAKELETLCLNDTYGYRAGQGIIQLVNEKYNTKLNSF